MKIQAEVQIDAWAILWDIVQEFGYEDFAAILVRLDDQLADSEFTMSVYDAFRKIVVNEAGLPLHPSDRVTYIDSKGQSHYWDWNVNNWRLTP